MKYINYDNKIIELEKKINNNSKSIAKIENELKEYRLLKNGCTFNQFEKVNYLLTLKELFDSARKRLYIYDNDIDMEIIYLLKNISSNVQVIIATKNLNSKINKNDIDLFLKRYINVNIVFKNNLEKISDTYIVLDYGLKSEKIIQISNFYNGSDIVYSLYDVNDVEDFNCIIDYPILLIK